MSEQLLFKLEDMHDTAERRRLPSGAPALGLATWSSPQSLVWVRKTADYIENHMEKHVFSA